MRNLALVSVQPGMLRGGRKLITLILLVGMLSLAIVPAVVNAQATATAATSGFGAAFGYAQSIGPIAYTQAGSIGNGFASGTAFTPVSSSLSSVFTTGPAAAFATSIGTPFGSNAFVQVASFFGGSASGFAFGSP
ncbi:MAG: hypothetical protein GC179_10465 [Anaerolineaceae bacterium]|nr:hypothetical protein [Anaerolineaceae bacterium]